MRIPGGLSHGVVSDTDHVTTPDGNVHGLKNVYVTDGGSIPSSGTSPGTETIIANALRISDGILKARGALPVVP